MWNWSDPVTHVTHVTHSSIEVLMLTDCDSVYTNGYR